MGRRLWQRDYTDGNGGNITVRVGDNLVWFIAGPQGRIRFTITLTANSWREVGEVEHEGGWRPFMEMNLKRVGE